MNDDSSTPRRIIIDEDWKSQVQAEKEALSQQAQGGPRAASPPPEAPAPAASGPHPSEAPRMPWPAASLAMLLNTLGTQALLALGQPADEHSPPATPDLDQAKYLIDTLQVLEDKTRGNLTEAEARMLGSLLHELRIGYVHVQQALASGGASR